MKMRKLFAGIVAAATLLSGMALGAASAQAAGENGTQDGANANAAVQPCVVQDGWEQNKTITLTAPSRDQLLRAKDTPREYEVVKLASYTVNADKQLSLTTEKGVADTVKKALTAVAPDYANSGMDPMQWISLFLTSDNSSTPSAADGTVRKFVDELTSGSTKYPLTLADPESTVLDPSGSPKLTLTMKTSGLYLIEDTSRDVTFGETTHHASRPMLVGTKITALRGGESCLTNADGTVNLKSSPEGGFEFTKINRDGQNLQGAKFVISKEYGGDIVYGRYCSPDAIGKPNISQNCAGQDSKYSKDGTYTGIDGKWDWARFYPNHNNGRPDPNVVPNGNSVEDDRAFIFTSDENGKVTGFRNLPVGTYTITEIQAPDGYYGNDLPSFKIDVNDQGLVTTHIGENDGDPHDLVQNNPALGLVVINVKFELPHTGAAGIALFIAVGVLLLGTAIAVYVKSRRTKAMLR